LPESFRSYLMGGGITRAPGFLFAVLALGELASVYPQPRASHVILSALFAGLTILSHPLMTWFLAISAVVFFLALGRSRPALSNSLVAAGGAVALSAPWWITVLIRHGLDAFLAATNHGWPTYTGLLRLLLTGGTSEPFLPILLLMALLGGVVSRRTKHGWIVAWWVALFVFDTWLPEKLAIAPLALLAGLGLTAGLERLLSLMLDTADGKLEAPHPFPQEVRWLRIGVLAYGLFAAMYAGALTLEPLSTGEQQAMQWAAQNTEPESCFLVLSGDMWSRDRSAEWFPALAERTSVATVQGSEWIGSGEFDRRRRAADEARKCVVENAACLESWIAETGAEVTDVYVAKRQPLRGSDYGAVGAVTLDDCCLSLRASLDGDLRYTTIYDGPDASIYKRSAGP